MAGHSIANVWFQRILILYNAFSVIMESRQLPRVRVYDATWALECNRFAVMIVTDPVSAHI